MGQKRERYYSFFIILLTSLPCCSNLENFLFNHFKPMLIWATLMLCLCLHTVPWSLCPHGWLMITDEFIALYLENGERSLLTLERADH